MVLSVMWAVTAAMLGFMLGRVSMYGQEPEETGELEDNQSTVADGGMRKGHRGRNRRAAEDMRKWSVGSPVSGEVTVCEEGEHSTIVIRPEGDKLYAPAAGKITRLFPMGNAFLFVTEFGTELYVQVGDTNDELLVRHYRPRIVQNEVVAKGKLLLEFDRQGLEAEGASSEISICVESCAYGGDVRMMAGERVKVGEEILQVREPFCAKAVYQV